MAGVSRQVLACRGELRHGMAGVARSVWARHVKAWQERSGALRSVPLG